MKVPPHHRKLSSRNHPAPRRLRWQGPLHVSKNGRTGVFVCDELPAVAGARFHIRFRLHWLQGQLAHRHAVATARHRLNFIHPFCDGTAASVTRAATPARSPGAGRMRATPCPSRPASIPAAPSRRGSDITRCPARHPSAATATMTDPAASSGWSPDKRPRRAATGPSPPAITCRPSVKPMTPSPGTSATSSGMGRVSPRSLAAARAMTGSRVLGRSVGA